MYSEHAMYDSDSVTSFSSSSSSSPSMDGVIFSENVQEWFQTDQPYQPEVQQSQYTNSIFLNDTIQGDPYWQYTTNGQSENSNYTYIFDPLPSYHGKGQSKDSGDKPSKAKRRRVQTPYQRKAANVRERRRMCTMNKAFEELRKRLPAFDYEKKLSRIETLKLAMTYISFMKDLSEGRDPNNISLPKSKLNFKDKLLKSMNEDVS